MGKLYPFLSCFAKVELGYWDVAGFGLVIWLLTKVKYSVTRAKEQGPADHAAGGGPVSGRDRFGWGEALPDLAADDERPHPPGLSARCPFHRPLGGFPRTRPGVRSWKDETYDFAETYKIDMSGEKLPDRF